MEGVGFRELPGNFLFPIRKIKYKKEEKSQVKLIEIRWDNLRKQEEQKQEQEKMRENKFEVVEWNSKRTNRCQIGIY